MKLYEFPPSPNCRKVSALIHHLGLEVERQTVNLMEGQQREPAFLALNPNGMVPVLETPEGALWESNAILIYLAEKAGSELWPRGQAAVDVNRWLAWQLAHFGPACATMLRERVLKPMMGMEADEAKAVEGLESFRRQAAVLEAQLGKHAFVAGDALTLADFALGAPLGYAQPAGLPLADYPKISAWLGRLDALPAWRDTAPRLS